MASDPQTVVGEFMATIADERYDDAGALPHPDFVVHEAGGMPFGGEYHGPRGFFDLYAKMNEGLQLTPETHRPGVLSMQELDGLARR